MKRLFGGRNSHPSGKKETSGPLTNKTVQVGQYHVQCNQLLGSGGYADIYAVADISSGARFALKHLRLGGDSETIAEVQREAKAMAKLKGHPNILRLHAVAFAGPRGGETDGFFLLDFCPGTLLDLMARHNYLLEDATVVHIMACISSAVAHMHRQRPPMAHSGPPAVVAVRGPEWPEPSGDQEGSRGAAAAGVGVGVGVEVGGEAVLAGAASGVGALGVLLYVLCFGRLPFTGDSKLQVLNAKYDIPPNTRPPQVSPGSPGSQLVDG
eukprot:gene9414-9578_t